MAVWLDRLGALLASLVLLTPVAGAAQPAPLGSLWRGKGGEVRVVACPPGGDTDAYCRALAVTTATRTIRLGGGYMSLKTLWQRDGARSGPDVLVLGDFGGSGGDADLFAVTLTPEVHVTKWTGERFDIVAVRPGGPALRLTLPFDIEYFNDAPHAGVIILPLPVIWSGNGLVLDRRALTAGHVSRRSSDPAVMRRELRAWVSERLPHGRDHPKDPDAYTQASVERLVGLMLSGHADQARRMLDRNWPQRLDGREILPGGEDRFWSAICRAVVTHHLWRTFGPAGIPHADLIQRGAALPA